MRLSVGQSCVLVSSTPPLLVVDLIGDYICLTRVRAVVGATLSVCHANGLLLLHVSDIKCSNPPASRRMISRFWLHDRWCVRA
jgi:hypothetical protein